jgi:hypothetical protein
MPESIIRVSVDTFFDRPGVEARANSAALREIRHITGRVWKTARRSIRTRKTPSAPGQPPHGRPGGMYKQWILFGYLNGRNPEGNIGVPGGVRLSDAGGPRMHALHEFGGTRARRAGGQAVFWDRQGKKWVVFSGAKEISRAREARRSGKRGKPSPRYVPLHFFPPDVQAKARAITKTSVEGAARYPKRPTFGPALKANLPWIRDNFPHRFEDAFVRGQTGTFDAQP